VSRQVQFTTKRVVLVANVTLDDYQIDETSVLHCADDQHQNQAVFSVPIQGAATDP
jgi:hypothetical protein